MTSRATNRVLAFALLVILVYGAVAQPLEGTAAVLVILWLCLGLVMLAEPRQRDKARDPRALRLFSPAPPRSPPAA